MEYSVYEIIDGHENKIATFLLESDAKIFVKAMSYEYAFYDFEIRKEY